VCLPLLIFQQQQQQQPFYGPLSGITWVSRYQKKHSPTHHPDHHPTFISFFHLPRIPNNHTFSNHYLPDFNGAREDNRGRYSDSPTGHHSLRTNQRATSIIPPFLRRMPFLPQPSQFILAWTGTGICWIAYPVAWFC